MSSPDLASLQISKFLRTRSKEMGITTPTSVQLACIPRILAGRNVLAHSPTGSGKTFAFALPILEKWALDPYGIFALVLSPTRELALQIKEQFDCLGAGANFRSCLIMGGEDYQSQALELGKKPHVVISTPGRLADHFDTDSGGGGGAAAEGFKNLKFLVIDEADRILNGDFDEQLECILRQLPNKSSQKKQTLFFTATMDENLKELANGMSGDMELFTYDYLDGKPIGPILDSNRLTQSYLFCPLDYKDGYLLEFLRLIQNGEYPGKDVASSKIRSVIIFTNKCKDCQILGITLNSLGVPNVTLHSRMEQKNRLESLAKFKSSQVPVLLATDVASRGLDIPQVDLVLNYSVPWPTDYVHRVGRAGRSISTPGFTVSIITPRDIKFLTKVENFIGQKLAEVKIKEKNVLKILTEVITTKRSAQIQIEDSDTWTERTKINQRKRKLLEGVFDSEDDS